VELLPMMMLAGGTFMVLALLILAFSGPSAKAAGARRLTGLRDRHAGVVGAGAVEAQLRRISTTRNSRMDNAAARFLPNPAELGKRLAMTGKSWTVGQYGMASLGIVVVIAAALMVQGLPALLALLVGVVVGAGLPHMVVGFLISRRVGKFTAKFPDAIELLVRGLRSGLPITETMGVVGSEVEGPVGEEFRSISDKMKIGRTIEQALQETADRLGTPEFQFFCITIAIQRETGGNLAETLANLADVLRKRSADEAEDQGDVVGIQGVGLYHRRAALHRLRHDLDDQPHLYAGLLHRSAADDRRRRRDHLDGHRRLHHVAKMINFEI
jgi:tight adherence protein B